MTHTILVKNRYRKTEPLHDWGSAYLGRRTRQAVQNAKAKGNRPTFQNVDRVQAPAEGRQALSGGAAGYNMSVGVNS